MYKSKRERKYAATYKAERLQALNALIDTGTVDEKIGARRAKAKGNDSWTRRHSTNVTGFHKPQKVTK